MKSFQNNLIQLLELSNKNFEIIVFNMFSKLNENVGNCKRQPKTMK